ncbi:MAG: hypothetical protein WB757_10620 [Candidatus Cybelea sp.]|jgi:hypothetical protein
MSRLFVVLFAGCMNSDNNHPRYANDLQLFGDFLSTMDGVDVDTLKVLHSDGSASFQFTNIAFPNVTGGTSSSLTTTLQSIANAATATDRFVFVASNHGGVDSTGSYLWCWGETKFSAASFALICSRIACQRQAYIFGQCNSGGFIAGLAGRPRVILTGTDPAGVTHPSNGDQYDEFLLRVAESMKNGKRKFADIFAAAKAADTASDNPQLSDSGGVGSDATLLTGP